MDFEAKASELLRTIVSHGSDHRFWHNAKDAVSAALQAAFEAGKKMGVKESHDENVTARVFEFANLVNEARTSGGIVDCTGAKAVVRPILGVLPVTADGCVAEYGRTYWVHIKQPVLSNKDEPFSIVRWDTIIAEECLESCEPCEDYEGSWNTDPSVCYSTREAAEAGRNNQ